MALSWPSSSANPLPCRPESDVYLLVAALRRPSALGAVTPAVADGRSAIDGPQRTTLTIPQVLIGGVSAKVTFSGLSPQFAGVNQINAIVPSVAGGMLPLQLEMGGVRTADSITIAVAGQ